MGNGSGRGGEGWPRTGIRGEEGEFLRIFEGVWNEESPIFMGRINY